MRGRTMPWATAIAAVGVLAAGAQIAGAAPPDQSDYSPVVVDDYVISTPNPGRAPARTVYFRSPDGVTCTINVTAHSAGCTGDNLPGLPPAPPTAGGTPRVNSVGTNTGVQITTQPIETEGLPPFRTLPPLHSITAGGVTCGVDDAGTTACTDAKGRGFVLSPQGSYAY